jgi:hypothetical protein
MSWTDLVTAARPSADPSVWALEQDAILTGLKAANNTWDVISYVMGNKPIPELQRRWAQLRPTLQSALTEGKSSNEDGKYGQKERGSRRDSIIDYKKDNTKSHIYLKPATAVPCIWTVEQDTRLKELKAANNTWAAISHAMGNAPIPELKRRWDQIRSVAVETGHRVIMENKNSVSDLRKYARREDNSTYSRKERKDNGIGDMVKLKNLGNG